MSVDSESSILRQNERSIGSHYTFVDHRNSIEEQEELLDDAVTDKSAELQFDTRVEGF